MDDLLKDRGYVIYPGKLTVADSFRIGCIGRLYPEHMRGALEAVRDDARGDGRRARRVRRPEEASMNAHVPEPFARSRSTAATIAWPAAPTVVVCLDGSEPGYIEKAIDRALRPISPG